MAMIFSRRENACSGGTRRAPRRAPKGRGRGPVRIVAGALVLVIVSNGCAMGTRGANAGPPQRLWQGRTKRRFGKLPGPVGKRPPEHVDFALRASYRGSMSSATAREAAGTV